MKHKTGLVWLWLSLVVIVGDLWSKYVVVTNFRFYESVNVFPIFIRRVKLVRYIKWFIIGIALGKGFGACIGFLQ